MEKSMPKCYVFNAGCIYNAVDFHPSDINHLWLVKKNIIGNKKFKDTIMRCWKIINADKKLLNVGINALPTGDYIIIDRTTYEAPSRPFECDIEFMSISQELVYNEVMDILQQDIKQSGLILKLKAGRGKSFIVARTIAECSVKTLIIVPGSSILENWVSKVLPHFSNTSIGMYYSKQKVDGDIVVITIQSAIKETLKFGKIEMPTTEYFAKFGMVVYDEVHNFATEKYSAVLWKTCFRYRIGISATPEDAKFEPLLYFNIGNQMDGDEIYAGYHDEAQKVWRGTVNTYKYVGSPEFTQPHYSTLGYIAAGEMVSMFEQDPHRNRFLIDKITELYELGRNIIVFTEHREHCEKLSADLLNHDISNEAPQVSILRGGTPEEALKRANQSRIIIITFGFGKEGISYDHLDTLVFATPRRSKMLQILPRIMRNGGDDSIERLYIDIVDTCTKNFRSQYSSRKAIYKSYGFKIHEYKLIWENIQVI